MPSLLDSPPQLPAAAGGWASLYAVQEPVKSRHLLVPEAAVAKKPACGGRKKNLETCTEALGCETGAVDAAPAGNGAGDGYGGVEVECAAERKRRAREEVEEEEAEVTDQGRARRSARGGHRAALPPPLTTLARGAGRVRMVRERRDGRLAVYAVRTPGLETERSGGRLRMRLFPLPCAAGSAHAACRRQEPEAAEAEEEGEYGVAKYVRGGRCVEPEGGVAAARRGQLWEPQQAAAFWVATPELTCL
ncbi:hypothetical protein ACP70R_035327 [Stipagrostis hirtigluma subsp. patula]